jgi:hypothetical protein
MTTPIQDCVSSEETELPFLYRDTVMEVHVTINVIGDL